MAKVLIGDAEFETAPLNYKRLKKAWPLMAIAQSSADPIENIDAAVGLVSLSIMPYDKDVETACHEAEKTGDATVKFSIPWIEAELKATQIVPLQNSIRDILRENELMKEAKPGEAEAAPAANSTETSTDKSAN